jgi:hypothetical protein
MKMRVERRHGGTKRLGVLVSLAGALALIVPVASLGAPDHHSRSRLVPEKLSAAISGIRGAIRDEEDAAKYVMAHLQQPVVIERQIEAATRALAGAGTDLESVDLVSADAPALSDIARAEKLDASVLKDIRGGRYDGPDAQALGTAVVLKKRALGVLEDLAAANAPFTISRVKAVFNPLKFETTYTVDATTRPFEKAPKLTASWTAKIACIDPGCGTKQGTDANPEPNEDPGCDNAGVGFAKPFEQELAPTEGAPFIWHHPSPGVIPPYHCDHSKQGKSGHQGLITVTVTGGGWTCSAQLGGTESYDALTDSIQAGEARKGTAPACHTT